MKRKLQRNFEGFNAKLTFKKNKIKKRHKFRSSRVEVKGELLLRLCHMTSTVPPARLDEDEPTRVQVDHKKLDCNDSPQPLVALSHPLQHVLTATGERKRKKRKHTEQTTIRDQQEQPQELIQEAARRTASSPSRRRKHV